MEGVKFQKFTHFPYKEIITILHEGKFKYYLFAKIFTPEINFASVLPTAK